MKRLMLLIAEFDDCESDREAQLILNDFRERSQPGDYGITIARLKPNEIDRFDIREGNIIIDGVEGELD